MANSTRLDNLQLLNDISNEFEDLLLADTAPLIETFLQRVELPLQSELLAELIKLELNYVDSPNAESASAESYLQRFPQFTESINVVFKAIGFSQTDNESNLSDESVALPQRAVGSFIGNYRISERLGAGGFAEVYLAKDKKTKRVVAVKAMRPSGAKRVELIEASFLGEAKILSELNHPALPKVYEIGKDANGTPFVAMEYVKGESYKKRLNDELDNRLTLLKSLLYVVESMAFVHENSVYHRDLKPANIVIGLDGKPVIVDFGLAVSEQTQRERAGEVAGSTRYMSPEQVRGKTHFLDGRSDIWALGVILYETVTGRVPFQGTSRREIENEILGKDPRPPRQIDPSIPKSIEMVCLRALQRNVGLRYLTCHDLADDLKKAMDANDSRQWLMSAQTEPSNSRKQVEVELASQTRFWTEGSGQARLPTLWNQARFWLLTRKSRWTENESMMMKVGTRRQLLKLAIFSVLAGVVWFAFTNFSRNKLFDATIEKLIECDLDEIPQLVEILGQDPGRAVGDLKSALLTALDAKAPVATRNLYIALFNPEIKNAWAEREVGREAVTKATFQALKLADQECGGLTSMEQWLRRYLQGIGGVVSNRTVYCERLPAAMWPEMNQYLVNRGYAAVDKTEYSIGGSLLVAAGWNRMNDKDTSLQEPASELSWLSVEHQHWPDFLEDFHGLKRIRLGVETGPVPFPRVFENQISFADKWLSKASDDAAALFLKSRAQLNLSLCCNKELDKEMLLRQLNKVVKAWEGKANWEIAIQARAVAWALAGDLERSNFDLQLLRRKIGPSKPHAVCISNAKVQALSGNPDGAIRTLESGLAGKPDCNDMKYAAACGYAFVARINSEQEAMFLERAKTLLGQICKADKSYRLKALASPDFISVVERFGASFLTGHDDWISVAADFDPGNKFSRRVIRPFPQEIHRAYAYRMICEGYVPQAVSIAQRSNVDSPVLASVWKKVRREDSSRSLFLSSVLCAAITLNERKHAFSERAVNPYSVLEDLSDSDLLGDFTFLFPKFNVAVEDGFPKHFATQSAATQHTLLLALAQYDSKELARLKTNQLREMCAGLKVEDPGVCAAAKWLQKQDGFPKAGRGIVEIAVDGVEKNVSSIGLSMVPVKHLLPHSILVANTETSVAQFDELMFGITKSKADSSALLPKAVSFFQAAEFCNLLSELEGIPKDQWCYVPGETGYGFGMTVKDGFQNLEGYRLPTPFEFSMLNHGGSTSRWWFGNSPRYLDRFAWSKPAEEAMPVACKIPNQLGLYDTVGNLSEWTNVSGEVSESSTVYVAGGSSWDDEPGEFQECAPTSFKRNGFRVVRTMK